VSPTYTGLVVKYDGKRIIGQLRRRRKGALKCMMMMMMMMTIVIIIIIIVIKIYLFNCYWTVARWQWLVCMYINIK
jgi:type IV secretory pathway component VirB8